jgi:predicted PurR-regulated permease PerM
MDKRSASLGGGLMAVAAAVIIFWGLRSLAFILAPLAMAMVITIAILPLPGWMTKKGVKPGLALILTILAVVGVLAGVGLITIASLGKLAGYLPSYAANLSAQSSTPSASVSSILGFSTPITATAAISSTLPVAATTALSNLSSIVSPAQLSGLTSAIVIALGKAAAQVFVVLFIFAFMLSAAFSLQGKSVGEFSTHNPRFAGVEQFTVEVRQYVNIMTVINFLVAIGNTVILFILGIPFAPLWGLLAFFMGFIPSIGWWISLIPPFFIAWSQYGIGTAAIVLISYVLINGGVQNIVQPKMMGKGLRISPLVVFVSVIFWATVLGGMGALIAVPLTMIVMKILESSESTRWISSLMRVGSGSDGEDSPEQKQAFEQLRKLGGRVRDAVPFGGRQENAEETAPADAAPSL